MNRPDFVDRLAGCDHVTPYYDDLFEREVTPVGWWMTAPWPKRLAALVWYETGARAVAALLVTWHAIWSVGRWETVDGVTYIPGPRFLYDVIRGEQSARYQWCIRVSPRAAQSEET